MSLSVFLGTVLFLYGAHKITYEAPGVSRWRTCRDGCRHRKPVLRHCSVYTDRCGGIPEDILEGRRTCRGFAPQPGPATDIRTHRRHES